MDDRQDEGVSSEGRIRFPPVYAIDESLYGNPIRQVIQPAYQAEVIVERRAIDGARGFVISPADGDGEPILAVSARAGSSSRFSRVLRLKKTNLTAQGLLQHDLSTATWQRHPDLSQRPQAPIDYQQRIQAAIESWQGSLTYRQEDPAKERPGLRLPQIGAIHAVHAHWTVSDEPATVVMPTGTGKTEVMLSILVSAQCPRLLVVVPTDALRAQISGKFLTLGILKDIGVVSWQALNPIVGVLRHMPRNGAEVDAFFERCNVVVTTMSVAGRCGVGGQQGREEPDEMEDDAGSLPESSDEAWLRDKIQQRMAHHCPFLFVDEAHHIAAQTWEEFKRQFASARVLQFTATPFRNDERPVGGRIIYNYPMRKAQEEGYFRPIRFEPVEEYNPAKADSAIATRAVERLRQDRDQGLDHTLMVRVESIRRAEDVFLLYQPYQEFNPVRIHTGMARQDQERARQQIVNGEAHIVVCVDMLGEGFDLPELKIAAFHDVRKSLAVTLQLAGRFTRSKSRLGDPTFIANIADIALQEKLSRLYAQDADWNMLLRRRSEDAIGAQVNLLQFLEGFKNIPKDIPLQNIRPPMNVITYQTECPNWTPERFLKGIQGADTLERLYHDVNYAEDTLVIVLAKKVPLDWAQIEGIYNWIWELYVLLWDKSQNLLFIAGSHSGGYCRKLADAVAGFTFDVPLDLENDLARRVLSPAFRHEFEKQGIVLPPDNAIAVELAGQESGWSIRDADGNRMFTVVEEDEDVRVSATTGFGFDVPLDLENDLARGVVSPAFRHEFEKQGIVLPPDNAIAVEPAGEESSWCIHDSARERTYAVVRKDRALSVSVTVVLVQGPPVFRCFDGVNLLKLHTVGLTAPYGRHIRYTMRAGSNVRAGLSETDTQNTYKSNIYGAGFENAERTGVGCSAGGRVWTPANVNLHELTQRCRAVGQKLLDKAIDPDAVLGGTLKVDVVQHRPAEMPLAIEWPELVYKNPETAYEFTFERRPLFQVNLDLQAGLEAGPLPAHVRGELEKRHILLSDGATLTPGEETISWRIDDAETGSTYALERTDRASGGYEVCYPKVVAPLFRADIVLKEPSVDGALLFEVSTGNARATFIQNLFGGLKFSLQQGQRVLIKRGGMRIPLEEFFDDDPPVIRFADGSFLEGSEHVSRRKSFPPYSVDKIQCWDWTGTDITLESQGTAKRKSSIQYRVIQELMAGDYDVIYDDDDPGEAADVVAVRMEKEHSRIMVRFFHCKFSKESTAGARTSDLYEVCGQAQKSIRWMETERSSDLFSHLLRRDPRERNLKPVTRLEKGKRETLSTLVQMSKSLPLNLEIYIVQPGLSRSLARYDQLRLLSVTESYLMETYGLGFRVIASP